VSLAKSLDVKASASWIGHPYFDVIDNSSDFENKICRMIAVNINIKSVFDSLCTFLYSCIHIL